MTEGLAASNSVTIYHFLLKRQKGLGLEDSYLEMSLQFQPIIGSSCAQHDIHVHPGRMKSIH